MILLLSIFLFVLGSCGNDSVDPDRLDEEVRELTAKAISQTPVSANNVASFAIGGTCRDKGERVVVEHLNYFHELGGTVCDSSHNWRIDLDLTSQNKSVKIGLAVKAGKESVDLELENLFICPQAYVAIPGNSEYELNSFCLSKFEFLSSSGLPKTFVTLNEAKAECLSLGAGYSLTSNSQWQVAALNIMNESKNWSVANSLSHGNMMSIAPWQILPPGQDSDPCHGYTSVTCSQENWHEKKRTFKLNNGEVVWDLAGNAWEWIDVDASPIGSLLLNYETLVSQFDLSVYNGKYVLPPGKTTGDILHHFGTSISHSCGSDGCNLGYAILNGVSSPDYHLTRGGGIGSSRRDGLLSTFAFVGSHHKSNERGFRCVFQPGL